MFGDSLDDKKRQERVRMGVETGTRSDRGGRCDRWSNKYLVPSKRGRVPRSSNTEAKRPVEKNGHKRAERINERRKSGQEFTMEESPEETGTTDFDRERGT